MRPWPPRTARPKLLDREATLSRFESDPPRTALSRAFLVYPFPSAALVRSCPTSLIAGKWSSKSNGVTATLTLGINVNLLRVQFPAVSQVSSEEVEQHWPQQ
ncbi:unnamed protein product [Coccothraustes coccothraustes]